MRPRRPGHATIYALIALPVMLGVLVLVLWLVRFGDTSTQLRNAGVASALGGVDTLADDALLTDDPDRIGPLFEQARKVAAAVGGKNLVEGRPLTLAGPTADAPGDLVFGFHEPGADGSFRPLDSDDDGEQMGRVDAVRLTARHPWRDKEFTRLTAVFDRHVAGFRPLPDRAAPLVPVALYDGPSDDGRTPWSEALAGGEDEYTRTSSGGFLFGPDGIKEVVVRVGWQQEEKDGAVCGFPLRLAGATDERAVEQIAAGLSAADLSKENGELRLGGDGTLTAYGDPELFLPDDLDDDRPLERFRALAKSGEPRVWPVFRKFADQDEVELVGFTTARVVAAEREKKTGAVRLTLQPAVLATPTALTDPARPVRDRTVGRVRIAG